MLEEIDGRPHTFASRVHRSSAPSSINGGHPCLRFRRAKLAGDSFTATVTTPITPAGSGACLATFYAEAILAPSIATATILIAEPGKPVLSYAFPGNFLGGGSNTLTISAPNSGVTVNGTTDPNSAYASYVRRVIGIEGIGASFNEMVELAGGGAFPLSFVQPGTYAVVQNGYPNNFFGSITAVSNFTPTTYAQGELEATSLTVSVVGQSPGVPESASWALMIFGFGLMGRAIRERRAGHLNHAPG